MDELKISAWVKLHRKEIVSAVIGDAKPQERPAAFVMAGIPGAGKTEFLSHITPKIKDIVIIDLDNIVSKIWGYRPEDYYKFRKPANILVSAILTTVLKRRLDFALDGTFSHEKGAQNIERALKRGYEVDLIFVDQNPDTAWEITKARRLLTGRPIERGGFAKACENVIPNIQNAIEQFRDEPRFFVSVVNKSSLELEAYEYIDEPEAVDNYLKKAYDIYRRKEQ